MAVAIDVDLQSVRRQFPALALKVDGDPVVYLDKWGVYGVARYEQVHAVLNDPATFCSSRGVGLSDFAKEKPWRPASLILEADPPAHTRTRAVLNQVLSADLAALLRAEANPFQKRELHLVSVPTATALSGNGKLFADSGFLPYCAACPCLSSN